MEMSPLLNREDLNDPSTFLLINTMGKLFDLLSHPDELVSVIHLLGFRKTLHKSDRNAMRPSLKRCYEMLFITSRSFAKVIEELHPELKDVVMIFYLLLRALDTVEDDMSIDPKIKVPWLKNFSSLLKLKEYLYHEVDEKERDRVCLVEFTEILTEFHRLKPEYQEILADISKRMGDGMAHYIVDEQFNTEGVATNKDFDLYCHYVAGIVGEGLTRLFILAGFSDESLAKNNYEKANSMGLFLQKTNITRDFNEDYLDGRSFWPKEIWSKYTDKLGNFADKDNEEYRIKGVQCINDLVLNALQHCEDVLHYLSLVKDPSSFNFCAIPQVMAVATMELVFNNPDVLYGNVKIRRGTTCQLILQSRTFPDVVKLFRTYLRKIHHKAPVEDPNYFKITTKIAKIEQFCDQLYPDPKNIPAGAKVTNNYSEIIKSRKPIDDKMQKIIQSETFKCYLSIASIFSLFGGVLYYIFF